MSTGRMGLCCCGPQWMKVATIMYPWRRFEPFWQGNNLFGSDPEANPEILTLPDHPNCTGGWRRVKWRVEINNIQLQYECNENPGVAIIHYADGPEWAEYQCTLDKYDVALDVETTSKGFNGSTNLYDDCDGIGPPYGPPYPFDGSWAESLLCYGPLAVPSGFTDIDSVTLDENYCEVIWSGLNPDGVTRCTCTFLIQFFDSWTFAEAVLDLKSKLYSLELVGAHKYTVVTACGPDVTTEPMWFAAPTETTGAGDGDHRLTRLVKFYHPTLGWTQFEEDPDFGLNPPNACDDPYMASVWKTVDFDASPDWIIQPILSYDDERPAALLRTSLTSGVTYCGVGCLNTLLLARRARGNFPSGIDCIRRNVFENADDDVGLVVTDVGTIGHCYPYWRTTACIDKNQPAGLWLFDPWVETDLALKQVGDVSNGRIWISYPEDRASPTIASCCDVDEPVV
jgi:hypothetical protein